MKEMFEHKKRNPLNEESLIYFEIYELFKNLMLDSICQLRP